MTVTTLSIFLSVVSAIELNDVVISAYVDKPQYMPGEDGRLYINILNYKDKPVEIENITILYSWFGYVDNKWVGNETIIPASDEKALTKDGGKLIKQVAFTVPNDGRILSGDGPGACEAQITVYFDDESFFESIPINVAYPQWHVSLQDMDKLMSLVTVQIVLTIVCTVILAAAIFLSRRKAPATWKKEEPKTAPP